MASAACSAWAETFNIVTGEGNNIIYATGALAAGEMTYSNGGATLTLLDKEYSLASISSMYVDNTALRQNTVTVNYDNSKATVTVDAAIARFVDISISGAKVSIIQADDAGADTSGEIIYVLKGTSEEGAFYMEGSYKSTVELAGVNLSNPDGAAIDIQNGKRIKLKVTKGSENTLSDGAGGKQKGCLVCKGHLEISGKGSLNLSAHTSHALYAKEYITLEDADITIDAAVKDGVNCNQYLEVTGGSLTISGVGDDGIQVAFKDDTDREAEDTGSILISGGTLNVAATATASKAIKADGDITISGGTITASVAGGGKWDDEDLKTKAATCISADGDMTITGGSLNLTATGAGGKGISIDGNLSVSDGEIKVSTSGGMYAYVNGKEYSNYTGNTDNLASDLKSSPKGIKADGDVHITGGTFDITTKGNGGEGIESKAVMTIDGGVIVINSYDDGLNSSSHMHINGGDITVIATNNDAIDSNGNMYIAGGTIRAFGASAPECGIDANEEGGYSVVFTGGYLLACGGSNSTPSTSASTQAYVSTNLSLSAGATVELKDGDTVLATFTVPENYTTSSQPGFGGGPGGGRPGGGPGGNQGNSGVLISCPGLTSGSNYTMSSGSSSASATARLTGGQSGPGRPW